MVKVYALSTCPYCKMTRKFLEENGVAFDVVEVDLLEGEELESVKQEVKRISGGLSFPVVVVDEKPPVVGYDVGSLKKALDL